MTDEQVREFARQAMVKHRKYARVVRTRNRLVVAGTFAVVVLLVRFGNWKLGTSMMLAGGLATAFLLAWNLIWLNTVMYRITREEIGESGG